MPVFKVTITAKSRINALPNITFESKDQNEDEAIQAAVRIGVAAYGNISQFTVAVISPEKPNMSPEEAVDELLVQTLNFLHKQDFGLTKAELKEVYEEDKEHPFYTREQHDESTSELGYWNWVVSEIKQNTGDMKKMAELVAMAKADL